MKKIIFGLAASLLCFGSVSADIGVNIGVSGQAGLFIASATEKDVGTHGTTTSGDESNSDTDVLPITYGSIFIEKTLGSRFLVGIDYVPTDLATETMETTMHDYVDRATTAGTSSTNRVQVDFSDLTTIYIGLNLTENSYIKAGTVSVDINTNENLASGVTYGNTTTDGSMVAMGYNKGFGSGFFVRGEMTYMDFDGVSVTNSNSTATVTMNSLDGVSGKLSVGKSF